MFKKILCPLDFSESSVNALRYAVKLAVKDAARLYLIYVEDKIDYGGLRLGTEYSLDSETVEMLNKKLIDEIPEDAKKLYKVRNPDYGW